MRHLIIAAIAILISQERNEAEELFKKMEEKILSAKTLQIRFHGTREPGKLHLAGDLKLNEGNKSRIVVKSGKAGDAVTTTVIVDGKTLVHSTTKGSAGFDAPESLEKLQRISVARAGLNATYEASVDEGSAKADAERAFIVKEFTLGVREKVGERQGQAIEYKLARKYEAGTKVVVWIDVETHLPLKRTLTLGPRTMTEYYSSFKLDEKLEVSQFEHPKEGK